MTQNNTQFSEHEIKRYLYGEMSDEEQATIEESFFTDDTLFFEITDTENRLVDLYARGKLPADELVRFDRSLKKLPERRAKVANAVALQTLIDEERKEPVPIHIEQTFWQKLAEFFTFKTPSFGYAMGGLLVLFALGSLFLLLENRRQSSELARLQNAQNGNLSQREIELQNQLANVQKREGELQNQVDSEREASGDLTDELETEKVQRERLESELEKLRKERDKIPTPTPKTGQAPMIASVLLTPSIGSRGGGGTNTRALTIERATKRVAVRLALPAETNTHERVSVQLNDTTVARNLVVRVSDNGQKSVQLNVATQDLADGLNKLSIIDDAGKEISQYIFTMQKK